MTDAAATPEPVPSPPAPGLKACAKCGEPKPLLAFPGRRNTCDRCIDAAKARRQERKEAIAYTPALGERICDLVAMGYTITEIAEMSGMPTARQMAAWRRGNPEFDAAMLEAEAHSAAAHIDKAKEALRQAEAGKVPVSDAKQLADAHLRLARTLNPKRYGSNATVDITTAGRPLLDFGAVVAALIATIPQPALPAPRPIEAEAVPADGPPPGAMLQ
jgi:hypothetical protein